MSMGVKKVETPPVSVISRMATRLPFHLYESKLLDAEWFRNVDAIVLANQERVGQFISILQEEWAADVSRVQFLANVKTRFGAVWDDELVGPVSGFFSALSSSAKQQAADGVQTATASIATVRQFLREKIGDTWEEDVQTYLTRVIGTPSANVYALCVAQFQTQKGNVEYYTSLIKEDLASVWDEKLKARVTELFTKLQGLDAADLKAIVQSSVAANQALLQERVASFLPLDVLITVKTKSRAVVESSWTELLAKSAATIDMVLPVQGEPDDKQDQEAITLRGLGSRVRSRLSDRLSVDLLAYREAVVTKVKAGTQALSVEEIKGKVDASVDDVKAKLAEFQAFLEKFKQPFEQGVQSAIGEDSKLAAVQDRVGGMLRDAVGVALAGRETLAKDVRAFIGKAEEFSRRVATDIRDEQKRTEMQAQLTVQVQALVNSLRSLFYYSTIESFFVAKKQPDVPRVSTPVLD
jgi:hypothetical protein